MKNLTDYSLALRTLQNEVEYFKGNISQYIEGAVVEKEDAIIKALQNQLYMRGINSKGVKIMSYMPYTETTIGIKLQKHQPTTRVTLKDTGSFYAHMRVMYEPDGFRITSDDLKTDELIDKYGPEILGLTEQNLTRVLTVHLRKSLRLQLRRGIRQAKRVAKFKANYEKKYGKVSVYRSKYAED